MIIIIMIIMIIITMIIIIIIIITIMIMIMIIITMFQQLQICLLLNNLFDFKTVDSRWLKPLLEHVYYRRGTFCISSKDR